MGNSTMLNLWLDDGMSLSPKNNRAVTIAGLTTIATPFTLGTVSVTATGTQLNYLNGATGTTGTATTNLVFSTSPTFATSITGSYLTASEILITDADKKIVSAPVATYPSLTELSYVKGLSSAIQTQMNLKAPLISPSFTTPVLGTATGTALDLTVAAAGNDIPLTVTQNDTTNNPVAASITNAGTGNGLFIDQNGNGIALNIDSEATSAAGVIIDTRLTTGYPIEVYVSDTVNGGLYFHDVSGTQYCNIMRTIGEVATNRFYRNLGGGILTNGPVFQITNDHASDDQGVLSLIGNGTGNNLFIDQNADGLALNIDKDCTVDNTRTWAAAIASDNAGTGTALGCGIDMSSFAVDEPLFKVVADAGNTPGTLTGQIAIDVAGTTYYVYYYTTSTVA